MATSASEKETYYTLYHYYYYYYYNCEAIILYKFVKNWIFPEGKGDDWGKRQIEGELKLESILQLDRTLHTFTDIAFDWINISGDRTYAST